MCFQHYNHVATQNKQANDAAYKQWVEKHTPEQIRIANTARLRLKRKESKAGSQKYSSIEDPRFPKKPLNARAVFTKERWATGDMKGISLVDAAKTINEEWKALSAAEKKVNISRILGTLAANTEFSNSRIRQQQRKPATPESTRPSSITRCHHTANRQQPPDSSISLQTKIQLPLNQGVLGLDKARRPCS